MSYDYIREDIRIRNFYPLPAKLLCSGLSSTTIIVYSVLLGESILAVKNHCFDDQGRAYIKFSYRKMCTTINRSYSTVKVCLRELEQRNFIVRERAVGDCCTMYVLYPSIKNS